MRILFCSPNPLSKEAGAAKVLVELSEEMRRLGWICDVVGPVDVHPTLTTVPMVQTRYSGQLRRYLCRHADKYDVVDYDHAYLPFSRSEFSKSTLMVARSVLLTHHLETIKIPSECRQIPQKIGRLVKAPLRTARLRRWIDAATHTIKEADLVNVSNRDDKAELVKRGIAPDKVMVVPYGISSARRRLFDDVSSHPPRDPVVAFVGTFDYRKGAKEFPGLLRSIEATLPGVRFRMLGTKGLFQTRTEVLAKFPSGLRDKIHVLPTFAPEALPGLLSDCSVGVFPSYMEGFAFGVLEMMAASVPVVAYDCPGPSMILPRDHLVPPGDTQAMAAKVIALLQDVRLLADARASAKRLSQPFSWSDAAQTTNDIYRQRLGSLTNGSRGIASALAPATTQGYRGSR